ncbi:MAG: phage major capsid protein [Solirubrobacterales bacterium]
MAATQSSLEAALDVIWTSRRFKEQLFEENRFLDKLKKTEKFTQGKEARVPVHTRRNGGFVSLPAGGGTLNAAGQQGYNQANFKLTHHHQQVAIQGDVLDVTEDKQGSIVSAADEEITRALNDMNRQFTRMSYGNGDALIAQCRTSSSNNLDLNLVSGKIAIERGWLFEGQPIDVGTATEDHVIVNGGTITAIDEANTALTLSSGNVTTEGTTHFVSQHGARAGEVSNEMNGLRNIISESSTLGGLSPASERQWKASVDSTTTTISIGALLTAQRKIRQRQGKSPTFFLTGLKQQQRFYELIEQQVVFGSDKGLEAGGDETAKWNGMEIFGDPDCPDELLAMGHWEHFFMVQQDDPYWQNKHTGGEKLAWIQTTDSYGGKLTWRANIAVDRRNDLFLFTALT